MSLKRKTVILIISTSAARWIFVMTGDMPGSLAPVLHDPPGLADITG